jgi:cytochrome c553
MKKMVFFLLLCSCCIALANGNPQAGEIKSISCVACHGEKGISTNPQWPSIAGQHFSYILKQLVDFKNKTRTSPIMEPLVANLTKQDMEDLAIYYSQLPLPEGKTAQKYLDQGQTLYRGGDFAKKITACIACHGPRGTGNSQAAFPVLSGQQAVYTMQQLQAFKEGKRTNDLNSIMRDISARMEPADMEAVANYIAGLH